MPVLPFLSGYILIQLASNFWKRDRWPFLIRPESDVRCLLRFQRSKRLLKLRYVHDWIVVGKKKRGLKNRLEPVERTLTVIRPVEAGPFLQELVQWLA